MASNNKQKDKVLLELIAEKTKLELSLSSLKESVNQLQNGDDGSVPYWNGKNAYNCISKMLTYIDMNYVLLDYVDNCINSLKK